MARPSGSPPTALSGGAAPSPELCPFSYLGIGQQPFVYPVPLFVQNTFIEAHPGRPASLEGFIEERQAISCPASRAPSGSGCEGVPLPSASACGPRKVPYCPGEQLLKSAAFGCSAPLAVLPVRAVDVPPPGTAAIAVEHDSAPECSTADTMRAAVAAAAIIEPAHLGPGSGALTLLGRVAPAASTKAAAAACGLPPVAACTSEAEAATLEPADVPGELPSVGSAGHQQGRCKPCAFYHTKGCSSEGDCKFCHMCEPGEKQRRQKEKRVFFGTMRQLQKIATDALPFGPASHKGAAETAA